TSFFVWIFSFTQNILHSHFASRKINDKRVKRNISEDFEGYIYLQKSGNIYQTL
ncbi:hypothetical protein OKE_03309, partial [Enterococcus faecium EnGen0043]